MRPIYSDVSVYLRDAVTGQRSKKVHVNQLEALWQEKVVVTGGKGPSTMVDCGARR